MSASVLGLILAFCSAHIYFTTICILCLTLVINKVVNVIKPMFEGVKFDGVQVGINLNTKQQ